MTSDEPPAQPGWLQDEAAARYVLDQCFDASSLSALRTAAQACVVQARMEPVPPARTSPASHGADRADRRLARQAVRAGLVTGSARTGLALEARLAVVYGRRLKQHLLAACKVFSPTFSRRRLAVNAGLAIVGLTLVLVAVGQASRTGSRRRRWYVVTPPGTKPPRTRALLRWRANQRKSTGRGEFSDYLEPVRKLFHLQRSSGVRWGRGPKPAPQGPRSASRYSGRRDG